MKIDEKLLQANKRLKNKGVQFEYEMKEDLIKIKLNANSGYSDYIWIRKKSDVHNLKTTLNNAFFTLFNLYKINSVKRQRG